MCFHAASERPNLSDLRKRSCSPSPNLNPRQPRKQKAEIKKGKHEIIKHIDHTNKRKHHSTKTTQHNTKQNHLLIRSKVKQKPQKDSSMASNPHNGGSQGNGGGINRPFVPAKNPYATKRKRPPANTNQQQQQKPPPQQQPKQPPPRQSQSQPKKRSPIVGMQGSTGASFSQAFGEIEDTEYYRTSVAGDRLENDNDTSKAITNVTSAAQINERAQQRAFEEAAATADGISNRDNQAFLQPHVLSISTKQRGNGVLNFIRNVPTKFEKIVPDFIMNATTCALFLSCKYHSLHPPYIHRRIAELKTDFKLRVLLVLVDVDDNMATLLFLNKLAVQKDMTLMLAWSEEEAARYLESYKALENNDASIIQRKEKDNFVDQAAEFLSAPGVNKTDSASLLSHFTSIKAITASSMLDLGLVTGLGPVKVKKLHDALHKPFSSKRQRERLKEKAEKEASAGVGNIGSEVNAENDKEHSTDNIGVPAENASPSSKQTV